MGVGMVMWGVGQLLGLLGSQLAQTLERERLHQEALARQRLEQDLNLARDIQATFLPSGEYCWANSSLVDANILSGGSPFVCLSGICMRQILCPPPFLRA